MITLEMLVRRERELVGALSEVQDMISHIQNENAKKMIQEQKKAEVSPDAKEKK